MFRDRTNLYVSYRRTFPHFNRESTVIGKPRLRYDEESNLGVSISPSDPFLNDAYNNMEDIELNNLTELNTTNNDVSRRLNRRTLPPLFVDIARDIDDYLKETSLKMEQLMKLYRQNSLPGFDDKSYDAKEIEDLSVSILQLFQQCYNIMKKLESIHSTQISNGKQLNRTELIILDNMTKRYAQKIQWESNKFRVLQNNYLKFLNKDDLKPIFPKNDKESSQLVLSMMEEEDKMNAQGISNGQGTGSEDIEEYSRYTLEQQQLKRQTLTNTNQRFLEERDEEIAQLANGVFEVSVIFREMQSLIINQGSIIDRIDYNLENTVVELRGANQHLESATRYQKRSQKCKLILLLTLCVIALFFFVMLKPHNHTTVESHTIIQHEPLNVDKDSPGMIEKTSYLEETENAANENLL